MKTTIKADSATVEGDYVIVKKTPFRATRFFLWVVLLCVLTACLIKSAGAVVSISVIVIFVIIDAILSSDEATYTVPKRDLVAIKHYPRKHKVTVVFDDEKSKLDILK